MSSARRRFRIIKEIAEGGFGKVYLAEQISSDGFSRIVAVKLLHAKWSTHDEVVMRTRDEARLLGLVRHQHIVKVEDLTAIDGKCAIVMEYLEGVDLKWMMTFLKVRELEFPRAALFEIVLAVSGALDVAFNGTPLQGSDSLRVIHRDIKPSNIFVTVAGGVKVLDFGTARANFAEREAKTQALAFGSQGYMAPERMLGEEDTPAADIFSLGITLYELLTLESFGRIPPRPNKFIKKVEERVASVPLSGDPEWCDQVRDTLRLMLSYDPAERPSAAQLVEIMEILAQDATDMGLRRYCRTLVSEAKANLPELDTGDPLTGTVVDEDSSVSFAPSAIPPVGAPPSVPDDLRTVQPAPESQPGVSVPGLSGTTSAGGIRPGAEAWNSGPAVAERSGPEVAVWLAGALAILLVGAAVVGVLVLAGVIVVVGSSDDDLTDGIEVPPTVPTTPPVPVTPPVAAGGRVTQPDRRADVAVARTTLLFDDPTGGGVSVGGPGGFRAEWDGTAPWEIGPLGEGLYSANVTTAGRTYRLKKFRVDGEATMCTFTFTVGDGEWIGGCE